MTSENIALNYIYEAIEAANGKQYTKETSGFFHELEDLLVSLIDDINDNSPYGEFKVEDMYGGEGQGESYYTVFSFTDTFDEKAYFRFDGTYSEFDEMPDYSETKLYKVFPKEQTTIVWETQS